ncbi:MAG: hypothetical protein ACKO69_07465, partial [Limnohabitans sp.]
MSVQQQGLSEQLQRWGRQLGFSQIGVAPVDLSHAEPGLLAWLAAQYHGGMDYMQRHGLKRARPTALVPDTLSIITARMNYLPRDSLRSECTVTANQASDAVSTHDVPAWLKHERQRLYQPAEAVVSL